MKKYIIFSALIFGLLFSVPALCQNIDTEKVSIDTLISDLTAGDSEKRAVTAKQLGEMGPEAEKAVPALANALKDNDVVVRANAAWALSEIKRNPKDALPALSEALGDSSWHVRGRAAVAMGEYGESAQNFASALWDPMADINDSVKAAAAGAYWQITENADRSKPILSSLLDSESKYTRANVVKAIARVGKPASGFTDPLLKLLQNDADPDVRAASAYALGRISDSTNDEVVNALREATSDEYSNVRWAARDALIDMGRLSGKTTPDSFYLDPLVAYATVIALGQGDTSEPETTENDLTGFEEPLKDHEAKLVKLSLEVQDMSEMPEKAVSVADATKWESKAKSVGTDALGEMKSFRDTLTKFMNAKTRRGLASELDNIRGSVDASMTITKSYIEATDYSQEELLPAEKESLEDELRLYIRRRLADMIGEKLHWSGVADIVMHKNLEEVYNATLDHAAQKVSEKLEEKTQDIFGIGFYNENSARAALKQQANDLMHRQVAKLLVKITSNEIVIEIAGAIIVDWLRDDLWPKLKAAMREKGNHEARVERSLATLDDARDQLYKLPETADLGKVRYRIGRANGTIAATKYLIGDLKRAKKTALLEDMNERISDVERTITITENRFLVHKLMKIEELQHDLKTMDALITLMQKAVDAVEAPEVQDKYVSVEAPNPPTQDENGKGKTMVESIQDRKPVDISFPIVLHEEYTTQEVPPGQKGTVSIKFSPKDKEKNTFTVDADVRIEIFFPKTSTSDVSSTSVYTAKLEKTMTLSPRSSSWKVSLSGEGNVHVKTSKNYEYDRYARITVVADIYENGDVAGMIGGANPFSRFDFGNKKRD